VVVTARDRQGLFADLALTIARFAGNVVGARIFTSSAGDALDVFYVQDRLGQPFGDGNPKHLRRLVAALESAALGDIPPVEARRPTDRDRAWAFAIASTVAIDNEASQYATVLETSGRDRPGLVEALARVISESNLSIQSAHVDSHGERAVDAFYVVTADGAKLTQPDRLSAVRTRLIDVLDAADPSSQTGRLPRARASSAR